LNSNAPANPSYYQDEIALLVLFKFRVQKWLIIGFTLVATVGG
jgi:hypothetical protein